MTAEELDTLKAFAQKVDLQEMAALVDEVRRLEADREEAVNHRDDYETVYIEAGIELRHLKARVAELEQLLAHTDKLLQLDDTTELKAAYDSLPEQHHTGLTLNKRWEARVTELSQAIAPIAAWAAATLQAKHDDQAGFMPGEAFVCGVNDVKLTVDDLRALIEVSGGRG